MSFFSRNRAHLVDMGIDPARLPSGQYHTSRFPVLHVGSVPDIDLTSWSFTVDGSVAEEKTWAWHEFQSLPTASKTFDIHCVTKWSKFDTSWEGVSVRTVWDQLDVDPSASHVMLKDVQGYTTNLPIEDFLREDNVFAHAYEGEPLDAEHGWPLRLVVPHLYFWKSCKWVAGFTVMDADAPGFWEQNGYHMYGDPFKEQRYYSD
jgi:DMSO/TMAO reductase YedYZ molybdopterin-dependent catalytic subunit